MREALLDRIIRLYGYESDITISFAAWCEEWESNYWNDTMLRLFVEAHESCPCFSED